MTSSLPIRSLLVANRSEIAIRVMRAASELHIRTVGIYSEQDRHALHVMKADESYLVGKGRKPLEAYLDAADILRVAAQAGVDAVHPGYGFLSENPDFAQAVQEAGMRWIGPAPEVMRVLGNKVAARQAAERAGVPVVPASGPLPDDPDACTLHAQAVGFPLIVKASWGGGGRGMRVVNTPQELAPALAAARREALAAFGNGEIYLERFVRRARHVEVQVLGDLHGNLVHLYERDCSAQRRHQKVAERAPAPYLNGEARAALCDSALRLMHSVGYANAGTVEFLQDADNCQFHFIEVNPRIQVEHTVTEAVTGLDLVKAQILIAAGGCIGVQAGDTRLGCGVPAQQHIVCNGHALQCRITTEDPANGFMPDSGTISAYRSAAGFGIRLDAGTAYAGAQVSPHYDSLLVKVTAWAPSAEETSHRMERALREFRIRGVATNLEFLVNLVRHPEFVSGALTTRFIESTPALTETAGRDRASRLLGYLAEVIVQRAVPAREPLPAGLPRTQARLPAWDAAAPVPAGTRDRLLALGPEGFARWMLEQPATLLTDTTLRDAQQSLLATRMRTADMLPIAPFYARELHGLFSLECWGGATFDVALRFLKEDPWERLAGLRERIPNILLQMLLRGSNAVGYANYPANVVRHFVHQAAEAGVDLFRVFDSLNWVCNMRGTIDAVLETGRLCEGTICYTGDLFDTRRGKYNLDYYLRMAEELCRAGVHILAVKDMAGVCRPRAAAELVRALKQETGLPVHFHTHDTSGAGAASVLAAVAAGADAVDAALDSMSGLTSQPNLSAIVAALAGTPQDPHLPAHALQAASAYFEDVRRRYARFEPDIRAGTADVYRHEMPGGQYTNLRAQAREMGLEHRWSEIADAYAQVNLLFGDIVKVTPTSKVVGDLALMMVASGLATDDLMDPARQVAFPESVVSLFRGELGFPRDGFPQQVTRRVLGLGPAEPVPAPYRPADRLAPTDLEARRHTAEADCQEKLDERQLSSYLLYPKQTGEFLAHRRRWGDTSVLPTGAFFDGLRLQEEIEVELEPGKTLRIGLQAVTADAEGGHLVQFTLNGHARAVSVHAAAADETSRARSAEPGNRAHVGAPMPGVVASIAVTPGQRVARGAALLVLEAMKMETAVSAPHDALVQAVLVAAGQAVRTGHLMVVLQDAA